MPTWAKFLLAVAVLLILLVVGCVGAGVYWWSHNKDALFAKGKAVIEEGQAAGRLTDNKGCLDQAVTRYKGKRGLTSGLSTGIFMQSCFQTSRPTPGFCDDVPKMNDFMRVNQWQRTKCEDVGMGSDPFCQSIFQTVEHFCAQHVR